MASLAFYLFSPTCLINSIKHEHSCKILYILLSLQNSQPLSERFKRGKGYNATVLKVIDDKMVELSLVGELYISELSLVGELYISEL